jgi:hypothetical protein
MARRAWVLFSAVVLTLTASGVSVAGLKNAWFSSGTMVQGQIIRNEGELPGETKVFESGRDKFARLFLVFSDLNSHVLRGELKDPDGKPVRKLNYDVGSVTRAGISWRYTWWTFNLEGLAPAMYTLEMTVDGGKPETYSFTLK